MSQQALTSLPLTPRQRALLATAGFETVGELDGLRASGLATELSSSIHEAQAILKAVDAAVRPEAAGDKAKVRNALEMYQEETRRGAVPTLCEAIDTMLGYDGVPLTKLTEICGAPGIGKTQMSMQLAINAQIPEAFGGLGGHAVYIDTEGSFMPARAAALAQALLEHLGACAVADPQLQTERKAALAGMSVESILSKIRYYRVHNYPEQMALLHVLPDVCAEVPVRLVVIDSVAFHFRQDFRDMALRTRLLNGMAQQLLRLATERELAVVLVNQMTTRMGRSNDTSHLVPALGESWGHACTIRMILSWQGNRRCATLYKSPSAPERTVVYSVTAQGIRDDSSVVAEDLALAAAAEAAEANNDDEAPSPKRAALHKA